MGDQTKPRMLSLSLVFLLVFWYFCLNLGNRTPNSNHSLVFAELDLSKSKLSKSFNSILEMEDHTKECLDLSNLYRICNR